MKCSLPAFSMIVMEEFLARSKFTIDVHGEAIHAPPKKHS